MIKNYIHKKKQYPLTLDNIYNDIDSYRKLWDWFKNATNQDLTHLKFVNTTSTNQIIQYEASAQESNKAILDDLSEDIILQETHAILMDLINSKTTN